jgi:hypothetical protein
VTSFFIVGGISHMMGQTSRRFFEGSLPGLLLQSHLAASVPVRLCATGQSEASDKNNALQGDGEE